MSDCVLASVASLLHYKLLVNVVPEQLCGTDNLIYQNDW